MKPNTAFGLFILGLLLALGGVGGIEHSLSDQALFGGLAVAALGLMIMYAGVLALNVSTYYDKE